MGAEAPRLCLYRAVGVARMPRRGSRGGGGVRLGVESRLGTIEDRGRCCRVGPGGQRERERGRVVSEPGREGEEASALAGVGHRA